MAYTVIARRYRSQTFDDVVGQDAVAKTLKNAIEMGRVAHAYLFCGTRGVGKTTMARILAKSLNCLKADGPTITPCLECDSCISVNAGEDIDVIEIDGASNTGVDNIRQLRENALYRPARARFKIYIIDEVHMLSPGAFNALLKILEEPPEHVKFIFATTEPNKVLATIQSRCQRFDFQHISPEVIGLQLEKILKDEKIKYENDLIIYLSRLANGSMRDALSLLDQLISAGQQPLSASQLNELVGVPDKQKVLDLLLSMAAGDAAGVLNAIEALIKSGQSSGQICDLLIENMRDLMVFLCAGSDSKVLVLTAEEKKQVAEIAQGFDVPALIYNITALEKLRWTLRSSETSRALLEALVLRLALSEHFMSLAQLGQQAPASTGVKKKSIVAGNTSASAISAQPVSMAHQVQATIESIQASWPTWIQSMAQKDASLGPVLEQAKPLSLRNSVLDIQFGKDGQGQFAKSMCQRKTPVIEENLSQMLGVKVTIRLSEDRATSVSAEKPPAPPKMNHLDRNEVLNDPTVQMVLKGLDATPVDIRKMAIGEPEEAIEEEVVD
ncbi:MAG: DNA polymerase III subunit gamma/tau [Phycisphaerae bacterium]|nr:DNA polymerase III subunit gamma/tau [Phycisphaerae bacterium]